MQKKILDKNYIQLFLSNMFIFYSFMMLTMGSLNYIKDVKTTLYIVFAALSSYYAIKLNIKIKKVRQKSIIFSFIVLFISILMHIFYFNLYEIDLLKEGNWQFLIIFIVFIIAEIIYYIKDIEYLENVQNLR